MNPALKRAYLLIALSAWVHVTVGGLRLAVTLAAIHDHASPAYIGVMMALFGLVGVFFSVPAGRWVDRHGTLGIMTVACAMLVLAALLGFFAPNRVALLVIALMTGTAWTLFYVATQHLLGIYGGASQRLHNFSISGVAFAASHSIGPVIAGFAIDGVGYPYTFVILGVLVVAPLLLIGLRLIDLTPTEPPEAPAASGVSAKGSVFGLLRIPALRRIYLYSMVAQGTWHSYSFLLPIFAAKIGLSASTIGLLLGCFAIAGGVARAFAPILARHFTPWQMLLMSFAAAGVVLVFVPFFDHLWGQGVLSFLLGLSLGIASPLAIVLSHEASPPGRVGEVVGLRVSMMYGVQAITPLAAGAMGAALGAAPVFWLLAALVGMQCVLARRQWHVPFAHPPSS